MVPSRFGHQALADHDIGVVALPSAEPGVAVDVAGHGGTVLFDRDAAHVQDHSAGDVEDAVLHLEPQADAPAVARAFLAAHRDHLAEDLFDDAQLLVSELVTNAVAHGRTAIALRVRSAPPGIGVAVADGGDAIPASSADSPSTAEPGAENGRGLAIVAALANAWGVVPTVPPPGKTVWFELHAS